MSNDRNALKAGLFIVASIAAIIAIVLAIKGVGQFLEPMQYGSVNFDLAADVGGLAAGDEVRIGGAKVGVVRRVALVEAADGKHHIVVDFSMPRRYALHHDAAVSIQSNITGTSDLNFTSLGAGAPLGPNESLTGKPAALSALFEIAPELKDLVANVKNQTVPKVNTAFDKVSDTLGVYKGTGQSVTELMTHVREKIDPVVDKYFGVADSAKYALQKVGDLFGDTTPDLRTTVTNLRDATGTIRERLPGLLEQVDGVLGRVVKGVDNANVALEDIKLVAVNTRDVTSSARTLLVTNRGKLDTMIDSLKKTGDNLKNASAEIRRSPWRLLYQPKPGEMNNLNLYDTARQFADGAGDLNEAALALRDALNDPKTEQADVDKLVDKLDKSFANFNEVEAELWKQVKE